MEKSNVSGNHKLLLSMPVELKTIADTMASLTGRNLSSFIRYLLLKEAENKSLITPEIRERLIDTKI